MRNAILVFIMLIGLVACKPIANSSMLSPVPTSTSSPTQTIIATKDPTSTPTISPTSTFAPTQDLSITKDEIVGFMVDYIVKNEIEAMIDIINKGGIPSIEKPPAQFIIILSPISQRIGEDYSKLVDALDTKNAEQVWTYENGKLASQTDRQTAIRDYQALIKNAPRMPSIFMWGNNEFGIVSISNDGQGATVYLATSCGSACGHGLVMVLVKNKDNQWEIKDIKPLWGS